VVGGPLVGQPTVFPAPRRSLPTYLLHWAMMAEVHMISEMTARCSKGVSPWGETTCDRPVGRTLPGQALFHQSTRLTLAPPSRGAFSLPLSEGSRGHSSVLSVCPGPSRASAQVGSCHGGAPLRAYLHGAYCQRVPHAWGHLIRPGVSASIVAARFCRLPTFCCSVATLACRDAALANRLVMPACRLVMPA
jgi:hypothetical protein